MKQTHAYRVDLTKIDGGGEFACPRCGAVMSPDDDTEETYSILGSKADGDGLEEMVIQCNKCSSHIHLTGFSLLQELSDDGGKKAREKKVANVCYIAHV
jgi:DNA-directed RNA polymerase subunit RPC12/RpoP